MFFSHGHVYFLLVLVVNQCMKSLVYKEIELAMILKKISVKWNFLTINHGHLCCQGCTVVLRTAAWWTTCFSGLVCVWSGSLFTLYWKHHGYVYFHSYKNFLLTARYDKAFILRIEACHLEWIILHGWFTMNSLAKVDSLFQPLLLDQLTWLSVGLEFTWSTHASKEKHGPAWRVMFWGFDQPTFSSAS